MDKEKIPVPTDKMPPALQHALRQNAEKANGPKLAYTGNPKLDELLAGVKEAVHRYEEVQLPSLGKFYDTSVMPDSGGIIHVRCMTGEEEEILATPRFSRRSTGINMIFKNCVREAITPEKMLSVDRNWLLIFLRGISYTPDYEVEVRCSECSNKFTTIIDLDSLMVRHCPEDFGEDLTVALPRTGYKIRYRLATGKDETLIQEYREKKMKSDQQRDDTWTYRASLLILDIEGMQEQAAIQELVSRLPIQDVATIRTLLSDPPFGVDTNVSIFCPVCTETFEVDMPMGVNFFFPKVRMVKNTQA